jgi:hypothetical protein
MTDHQTLPDGSLTLGGFYKDGKVVPTNASLTSIGARALHYSISGPGNIGEMGRGKMVDGQLIRETAEPYRIRRDSRGWRRHVRRVKAGQDFGADE